MTPTKLLPYVLFRREPEEDEGYCFTTALDNLVAWALENGYSVYDILSRVTESVTGDD